MRGFATFFAVTLTGCGGAPVDQEAEKAKAAPPFEVSAHDFAAMWKANELSAADAIGGRRVALTGGVVKVDDFGEGASLIVFDGLPAGLVPARVGADDRAQAAALRKGDKATVVCGMNVDLDGVRALTDCELR